MTPKDWGMVTRALQAAWARVEGVKCSRCAASRYEHHDHTHEGGERWPSICPFGDCGEFQS